jgi:MYXO-CTERM domain-containing protein
MRTARTSSETRRSALLRVLFAVIALVLATSAPRLAHAVGTVTLVSKEPEEANEKWKLNFTINYGSTPDIAYIPMIFSFTPTVLYERSLTDQSGEKPVITRKPLQGQQAINLSMDVGFSDPSGKKFGTTKFDFLIRRDKGFEAGEYDLKITRAEDGAQVGQVIKLKLKGDNPIIDRRAMVFSGEKKKKNDEKKEGDAAAASEKNDEGAEAAGDAKTAGSETPSETPSEAPPAEPPKQGGCGCRVAGEPSAPGAALASLLVGTLLTLRRRASRRA